MCCLNGAAARLTQIGDRIIVIAYAEMTPEEAQTHKPRVVVVDEHNNPKTVLNYSQPATSFSLETGLNVK